jgi:hypothetical protein
MKKLFLFIFIFQLSLLPLFSQENETPESIRQREEFIYERRAGGPGIFLPQNTY